MTREGQCPCGVVRFTIDGPIRDVIVCHCGACHETTGGPWPASAGYRCDLIVEDDAALIWERAPVSEYGASRGRCRACGTVVFWDAPKRGTVSFAAALLADTREIEVAAEIWCGAGGGDRPEIPAFPAGLPANVEIRWVS